MTLAKLQVVVTYTGICSMMATLLALREGGRIRDAVGRLAVAPGGGVQQDGALTEGAGWGYGLVGWTGGA
jgi:hypothetical protein